MPKTLTERLNALKARYERLHDRRRESESVSREMIKLTLRQLQREIREDRRRLH